MAKNRSELILEGLDCANCAAKIEDSTKKMEGVSSANLNFMTKTLTIETAGADHETVKGHVKRLVKKIEPDVVVREKEQKEESENRHGIETIEIVKLVVGAVFFAAALLLPVGERWKLAFYLIAYVFVGVEVVWTAVRNIGKGKVFDENFLMSIATIGAFAIGEYPEAVAVMIFYQVGELFQKAAVHRSRRSIEDLMDIRPDYANLRVGDTTKVVSPDAVKIGDVIVIKPGEKIPLDGRVLEGSSSLNLSALTGETLPREVTAGDEVLSGGVNNNGLLVVEVKKEFGESTVSKILDLVQNASSQKTATENFVTKFAKYYTPVVVLLAVLISFLPPVFLGFETFNEWLHKGLSFLVVSCPCALVISIPLGFFGGIGRASRSGILVKGSNYLDALSSVDTVVFDKTGTLTKGNFTVTNVQIAEGYTREQLIEIAAYAECFSDHPVGVSVKEEYQRRIDESRIQDYQEISGNGVSVTLDGHAVLVGNAKHMAAHGIHTEACEEIGTKLFVAVDGRYAGTIVIADEIKPDSRETIQRLKELGISRTVMLTGDNKATAEKVGQELGLDEIHAELLPDQKLEQVERLAKALPEKKKLLFVGDGINDAPVLARADVGVSMGSLGSDAAIEAADVVLMTDEPSRLVDAIRISGRTRKIVSENIAFSLVIKVLVLGLVTVGRVSMWGAVFADVGVSVLAILNSIRGSRPVGRKHQ